MENPTNNNQPADQEEVKQENTQAVAAEGEERKIGDGEEEKKGEGKLLSSWPSMHFKPNLGDTFELSMLFDHKLTWWNSIGEEAEELFETNWDLEVDNFDDMGLKEEVLRGIYAFGFKEPSPIQQKGILPII